MENENKIYKYEKEQRFAVVRKLPKKERFHANFAYLHDSKEAAQTEAQRLAEKHSQKFYVVEILSIAA